MTVCDSCTIARLARPYGGPKVQIEFRKKEEKLQGEPYICKIFENRAEKLKLLMKSAKNWYVNSFLSPLTIARTIARGFPGTDILFFLKAKKFRPKTPLCVWSTNFERAEKWNYLKFFSKFFFWMS